MAVIVNIPIENAVTDGSLNPVTSNAVFDGLAGKASGTGTANGTNTGDETQSTIKTKLGSASGSTDGYLLQADWNTFNSKQSALGFTPENVANKQTDLTASATKYPTVDAVNTGLSGKQATLVSGLNIKTINGTTLLGSGDLVVGGGGALAIGTTAITSGTDTRVLFQSGGVVQQSAGFTYSPTSNRLDLLANSLVNTDKTINVGSGTGRNNFVLSNAGRLTLHNPNSASSFDYFEVAPDSFGGTTLNATGTLYLAGTSIRLTANGTTIQNLTSSGVHIGGGAVAPSARLDVRAQGALSTDIAFRVRNSADSVSLSEYYGNGDILHRNNSNTSYLYWQSASGLEVKNGSSEFLFFNSNGAIGFQGTSGLRLRTTNSGIYINDSGNFYFGGASGISLGTGSNAIIQKSGTAPSSNIADHYYLYSADQTAGNACPHFRTENCSIIKLYQQSSAGITTVADLVTILQNTGLLS